jgi:O-antigen ligase
MNFSRARIENIFVITALFVFLVLHGTAFFQVWDARLGDGTIGSPALKALINSLTGFTFFLVLKNFNRLVHFFKSSLGGEILFITSTYFLLAALWSDSPSVGFYASFKSITAILLALVIYLRSKNEAAIRRSMIIFFIFIGIFNIVYGLFLPEIGRHSFADESWRGVFGNRNGACLFTCMALAYFIFAFKYIRRYRLFNLALILCCLIFIFMSNSGTGRISAIILISLAIILPFVAANKRTFIPMLSIMVVFFITSLALSSYYQDDILQLLKKERNLTGRTDIWQNIIDATVEKPIFGHGSQPVVFGTTTGKLIPHSADSDEAMYGLVSHNNYLTYLLNFGLFGLGLMITIHLIIFVGLLKKVYANADQWALTNLLFFVNIVIFQITAELFYYMAFWIFFIYLYIAAISKEDQNQTTS